MKALLTAVLVIAIVATSAIAGSDGISFDLVAESAETAGLSFGLPPAPF